MRGQTQQRPRVLILTLMLAGLMIIPLTGYAQPQVQIKNSEASPQNKQFFQVALRQDGRVFSTHRILSKTAQIKRTSFELYFTLAHPIGILTHLSTTSDICHKFKRGLPLEKVFAHPDSFMGIAEDSKDATRGVMMLDTDGAQYLYFTQPDDHRFTQVHATSVGGIKVSRLVNSYYGSDDQVVTWAQYPHDRLYISFVYSFVYPNTREK